MKTKQPTAKVFWTAYIKSICSDVHDVEYKSFLKPAVISHCRSYARLTNRDESNIPNAAKEFFETF